MLETLVARAKDSGVLRQDFSGRDLSILMTAMSKLIAISNGNDDIWRRHLSFVLDGLRAS
jgi:hypothetical protein